MEIPLTTMEFARRSFTGPVRNVEFAGEGLDVAEGEPEPV